MLSYRNIILVSLLVLFQFPSSAEEKNQKTSTSCESKDCKIYIKPKERKGKISENFRHQMLSTTNNLKLIQRENSKLEKSAQEQWKKRIENNLKDTENEKTTYEFYEKEMKFYSSREN